MYDGTDFYEFGAPRIDTGDDHGAGDTLAAAVASALAHGYTVPDAVAFAKSWVTECLRAAYPLGHGHGPVSPLFGCQTGRMNLEEIAGIAHEPDGRKPKGAVVLTHGAGGSRESALLKKICDEWAAAAGSRCATTCPTAGAARRARRRGRRPTDQAGVVEAIELVRALAKGPVIAGGHSYGGRKTSMVVAERRRDVDVLTLFSYPLHPPGKPERPRTEHLPRIAAPTVFTHGTSDPFGTIDELRAAAALIPASTEVVEITGARHDLGSKTLDVPVLAVDAALRLLS